MNKACVRKALVEQGDLINCGGKLLTKSFLNMQIPAELKAKFEAQLQEEAVLNKAIVESLARVKV